MRILPSLVLILAVTLIFALAGGGIAALISRLAPSYYPAVFPLALDPHEVGLGLGITQGIVAGLVVSLVLLGLTAWRNQRAWLQLSLEELSNRIDEIQRAVDQLQQRATRAGSAN